MKLLRARKPSPAMIVACIALFIALGGTSFAAVALTRNSVLSKHIKNGQVKRVDLRANAVNSAKVANGTLLAMDFATGQLPKGDKGDPGPTAGFGSTNASANPSSTPEATIATETVSLPTAGRLMILGRMTRSTNCSAGDVEYGLYVDGAAVPGSGVLQFDGAPMQQLSLHGVSALLGAGAHTLEIKVDCLTGNVQGQGSLVDIAITAVLLGS